MRRWHCVMFGSVMLGLGYVAGSAGLPVLGRANAQEKATVAEDKIRAANLALSEAAEALKQDGRYETITDGTNAFLILAGGGSARQDLERGDGVDPETFAALYAGKAAADIADQITMDDQRRLTFNGKVIQMYSKSTLQKVFAERLRLAGTK